MSDEHRFVKAAYEGDVTTVRSLLDQGVDVNCVDEEGYTALMRAALYDRVSVLGELLTRGADTERRDGLFGMTALSVAAGNGRERSVQRLLQAGADPNTRDNTGQTPIHTAGMCEFITKLNSVQAYFSSK